MKRSCFFLALVILFASSCRWMGYKRIRGNGNITTENRTVIHPERIKLAGSYDVEISQGPVSSVKVEADENLQPFIFTNEENGFLMIKSKEHVSLVSDHTIKIYIVTNKLEQLQLSGSGNITGKTKFTGGDKLTLKISGAGDMNIEVNTPHIDASIAGSGSMTLKGETQDQKINISGVGDYNADGLRSETSVVKIAGSGNVKVNADASLDVSIAGVGSVYYKGNATIKQHVTGSGEVKKME